MLLYSYRGSSLTLSDEAAAYLGTLASPVAMVCVAGASRTGKSFLANQLLGRMDGFDVRPGMYANTRGVWLWPSAQSVDCLLYTSPSPRDS